MLTNEQRFDAVKKRTKDILRKQQKRRRKIAGASAFAACFAIIFTLALAIPQFMANTPKNGAATIGAASSLFAQNGWIGYVFIAFFAFVLGVCFTLLCVLLRRNDRKEQDNTDDGGNF